MSSIDTIVISDDESEGGKPSTGSHPHSSESKALYHLFKSMNTNQLKETNAMMRKAQIKKGLILKNEGVKNMVPLPKVTKLEVDSILEQIPTLPPANEEHERKMIKNVSSRTPFDTFEPTPPTVTALPQIPMAKIREGNEILRVPMGNRLSTSSQMSSESSLFPGWDLSRDADATERFRAASISFQRCEVRLTDIAKSSRNMQGKLHLIIDS